MGRFFVSHLLRPTWHFVAREDIRWLLALTPRPARPSSQCIHVPQARHGHRRFQAQQRLALAKALAGGRHLTREELRVVLDRAGVATEGEFRMSYLLMACRTGWDCLQRWPAGEAVHLRALDDRAPRVKLPARCKR